MPKITRLNGTILERHLLDNVIADASKTEAIFDYNIMMGNIDDPREEENDESFTEV